jgi:hypothetical protein
MTEDVPELPSTIEEPGGPAALPPRLEIMERPRVRAWFQSSDRTQLLQLQNNRVAYNWKKGAIDHQYPSYDEVERRFRETLPVFEEFVAEEGWEKSRRLKRSSHTSTTFVSRTVPSIVFLTSFDTRPHTGSCRRPKMLCTTLQDIQL